MSSNAMRINSFALVNLGPMRDDGVQGWLAVNAIEQCFYGLTDRLLVTRCQ